MVFLSSSELLPHLQHCFLPVAFTAAALALIYKMVWPLTGKSWTSKRDDKLQERDAAIHKGIDALGKRVNVPLSEDLPILSLSACDIVKAITVEKKLTAVRVLEAFIRASLRSHENLNCLVRPSHSISSAGDLTERAQTEVRYVEALQQAKQLDDEFAKTGKPRGLLHGVPVSIKGALVLLMAQSRPTLSAQIKSASKASTRPSERQCTATSPRTRMRSLSPFSTKQAPSRAT